MHARRVVVTGTLYRRGGVRAEAIISTVLVSAATFLSWVCASLNHACLPYRRASAAMSSMQRACIAAGCIIIIFSLWQITARFLIFSCVTDDDTETTHFFKKKICPANQIPIGNGRYGIASYIVHAMHLHMHVVFIRG